MKELEEIKKSFDEFMAKAEQTLARLGTEQKQILDKEEKEYLEHYLRPFKYKVKGISKTCSGNKEFISIILISEPAITLPYFEIGKYYKRMRLDKEYTLEELGLFEGE